MASIKGFQMKSVKQTLGREGYGCTATLYLNGKKIGTYANYGDGGCEDVTYVSKDAKEAMMKIIIEYAKEHPDEYIVDLYKKRTEQFEEECQRFKKYNPYIPDEDITIETMSANSIVYIVDEFLNLLELEKHFKKYRKKGYKAISVKNNEVIAYPMSWTDENIKKEAEGKTLYTSLDDFCK